MTHRNMTQQICLQLCRVQCSRWSMQTPNQKLYFSTSANSLSRGEGGGLACYLQTEREKRQRFPVAISHLICTPLREGSLSAFFPPSPCKPAGLARLAFLRAFGKSGFSKGTKESGAGPIEPPSSPPQEVINLKHSSPPTQGPTNPWE